MEFDVSKHTVILTKGGSRAYGMHTASSDLDMKGAAVAPKQYQLGCMFTFEQAVGKENLANFVSKINPNELLNGYEGTIYELKKYIKLAAECNPNILDVLFCRESEIIFSTKVGDKLREHRNLFLTAKARWTYAGYAAAQLKRIKLHRRYFTNPPVRPPERPDFDLPEAIPKAKLDIAMDAIQKKLDSWEFDLSALSESERIDFKDQLAERLAEIEITSDEKWQCAGRAIGLNDELLSVLERERKFRTAQSEWKSYVNWKKNRNPERAALEEKYHMDTKHAAHLVRLLKMCREIMETGQVNVWRGDIDRDELLAIRNGAWTYEQVIEWADKEEAYIEDIYNRKTYKLPKHPDVHAINNLCVELVEEALSGQ